MPITLKLSNSRYSTNALAVLRWECYRNGRIAILLDDARTHEPLKCATSNVGDELELADDEVTIKDYAENEGTLADLVEAGIVEDTGRRHKVGYTELAICRLLVQPDEDEDPRILWREAFGEDVNDGN